MSFKKKNIVKYGSEKRVNFVKSLPCSICYNTPSDNAHVTSRGAGGSKEDIVPLCREHHQDLHIMGFETFQKKFQIDLKREASKLSDFLKGFENKEKD